MFLCVWDQVGRRILWSLTLCLMRAGIPGAGAARIFCPCSPKVAHILLSGHESAVHSIVTSNTGVTAYIAQFRLTRSSDSFQWICTIAQLGHSVSNMSVTSLSCIPTYTSTNRGEWRPCVHPHLSGRRRGLCLHGCIQARQLGVHSSQSMIAGTHDIHTLNNPFQCCFLFEQHE